MSYWNEMAKGRAETYRLWEAAHDEKLLGELVKDEPQNWQGLILSSLSLVQKEMKKWIFWWHHATKEHFLHEMSQALSSTLAEGHQHFPFSEESGISAEPQQHQISTAGLRFLFPVRRARGTRCAGMGAGRSRIFWRLVPDSCSPEPHHHLRS